MTSAGDAAGRAERRSLFKPRSPQRSSSPSYLYEVAEIRRLLERNPCREWWIAAILELAGHPSLAVHGRRQWAGQGAAGAAPHPSPCSAAFGVSFLQRRLGTLTVQWPPAFALGQAHALALAELASQCARIAQRLASQQWAARCQLGAPCLVGSSAAMLALDRVIEESCLDGQPVLLLGTPCNEALQTAVAIHCCSGGAEGPFVNVDWERTLEPPARWLERARGGTLFLHNVDSGSAADQEHLWRALEQALARTAPAAPAWPCRLVVARRACPPAPAEGGIRPPGFAGQSGCCCITLPLLAQRPDDIPLLARATLDYYGHGADMRVSDALLSWCAGYHWPGNAAQLEWTVARMALLTPQARIGARAIARYAPRLVRHGAPPAAPHEAHEADGADEADEAQSSEEAQEADQAHSPDQAQATERAGAGASLSTGAETAAAAPGARWVRCVVEQDSAALASLPPGLNRALQYVGRNYHEAISAEQLAAEAYVSVSHLRFLFRDHLGLSFRLFLQRIRIAHAARLLQALPPRKITDVALSVGFNDFSHFQKCFRQILGQTPGQLRRRRQAGEQDAAFR